jgi:hypothetical protein
MNRREIPDSGARRSRPRNRLFAGSCRSAPSPAFCLPCRRSRVRIPSAASGKGLQIGGFFGPSSSPELLSSRGLAEDRPAPCGYARFETRRICRRIPPWSNHSHSAGVQKVEVTPAAAVGRRFLQTAVLARRRLLGAIPAIPNPRGRVRFQSGYREVDPGAHSYPGEP